MEDHYAVIELNVIDQDLSIIYTSCDKMLALDFMNKVINSKELFQQEGWYDKVIESETVCSIYQKRYLPFRKFVIYKYFIQPF